MLGDAVARAIEHATHKPKVRFDGTFNFGHVLILIGWIGASIIFGFKMESRVSNTERELADMRRTLAVLSENQSAIIKAQERLSAAVEWFVRPQDQRLQKAGP